jgi:hypothetical protein
MSALLSELEEDIHFSKKVTLLNDEVKSEEHRAFAEPGAKGFPRSGERISPAFILGVAAISIVVVLVGFYFIKRYVEEQSAEAMPGFRQADSGAAGLAAPVSRNEVRLFFTSNGKFLTPFAVDVPRKMNTAERAEFILRTLLKGSPADYLVSPIPQGTTLRGFYMLGNVAVVDFSKELSENLVGGLSSEQLCAYSIVNSLIVNCEDIKAVRILIDGKKVATLHGNIDLESPLVEDVALIRW